MNDIGLRFHHMGLALKRDDEGHSFLESLGYSIELQEFDPIQNVNLRLYSAIDQPAIEMVLPGEGEGPLTPIFKQYNELIYHLCYEVESIDETIEIMEKKNFRLIPVAEAKPTNLFENRHIAFLKVMGFGLIELLETKPR